MTRVIDRNAFLEALESARRPFQEKYYAMYSSIYGGIVTDPLLMLVPLDDHLVHRGDGVFESCKCVAGGLYNLVGHLERLEHSIQAVGLRMPCPRAELVVRMEDTLRAGGQRECSVRIVVSRGPGSFSVNPYDCPEPALYIAVTALGVAFMERRPNGATVRRSLFPAKPAFFAGVKNCNYLPNVLMKKEAVDAGVDFVVSFDHAGNLAEGPTENMGIVDADGLLTFPKLDNILRGTTMMRVVELAESLVQVGLLRGIVQADISERAIYAAREVLIAGTTTNVTAVREYNARPVGDGMPGPVAVRLNELLVADIRGNASLRSEVW